MRVAVFGSGAIGGIVGAHLARHAQAHPESLSVSLVARGEQLAAMRRGGLEIHWDDDSASAHAGATWVVREDGGAVRFVDSESPAELAQVGAVDYLLCTVKGFAIAPSLPQITPLLDERSTFVNLHNGLPL